LRLLAFSDLHLHPYKTFADFRSGDNSRRVEILKRLDDVITKANSGSKDGPYDCLVFTGDFFHERRKVDVISMVEARNSLSKLDIPFVACSGTHDVTRSGHSSLTAFEELKEVMEEQNPAFSVDRSVQIWDENMIAWTFLCIPDPLDHYQHQKKVEEALALCQSADNLILVTHGNVLGDEYGMQEWMDGGLDPAFLRDKFLFSIVGHYHIPFYSDRVLVPGAVIPHGFGDECGGGNMWDVKLEMQNNGACDATVTTLSFPSPAFVSLYGNEWDSGLSKDNYYRIYTSNRDVRIPAGVKHILIFEEEAVERVRARADIQIADSKESLVNKFIEVAHSSIFKVSKAQLEAIGRILVGGEDKVPSEDELKEIEKVF